MKLIDLNSESVKGLSNQELLNLHRRVHQLHKLAKNRKDLSKEFINFLIEKHKVLENELVRRNLQHKTPLIESYLNILFSVEDI